MKDNYIKLIKRYIGTIDDWIIPLIVIIITIIDGFLFATARKKLVVMSND